jgi:chromosome segregation ATPase
MSTELEEVAGSLAGLEERIMRTVQLVSELRKENRELRQKLATAEEGTTEALTAAHREAAEARGQCERLQQEIDSMQTERRQVRTRIEKLLGQMDLLSADS